MSSSRTRDSDFRDTAEQWEAVKDRCVVDRETLRDRMRRGWALGPALVTPKANRKPVIARIRAVVRSAPGITADGLRAALHDKAPSIVDRTLGREVAAGRIRTVTTGAVVRHWIVPADGERAQGRPHNEDAWTPGAWVHPIRARALGLPVATRTDDDLINYVQTGGDAA